MYLSPLSFPRPVAAPDCPHLGFAQHHCRRCRRCPRYAAQPTLAVASHVRLTLSFHQHCALSPLTHASVLDRNATHGPDRLRSLTRVFAPQALGSPRLARQSLCVTPWDQSRGSVGCVMVRALCQCFRASLRLCQNCQERYACNVYCIRVASNASQHISDEVEGPASGLFFLGGVNRRLQSGLYMYGVTLIENSI